ncbi:MAG TPA: hypothetical protein VK988_21675 [Acidimicrobiales bacterium]|nr:hypothetical protein [Acidimicrobiales bacterium]
MEPDPDFEGDGLDQMVSAVVELREDAVIEGAAVEDPSELVSEAAGMLAGVDLGLDEAAAPSKGEPAGTPVPSLEDVLAQESAMAKAKRYFEKAKFDIHAPIGRTFSIAARRSYFEQFFGQRLLIDEEQFFAPVTTADGGDQLPVDGLPEEIRSAVKSISLPPPPELPPGVDF